MDKPTYLIEFNNGVYDLKSKLFRDKIESDIFDISVDYSYEDFTEEHPDIIGFEKIFSEMFSDHRHKEMFLKYFATFFDSDVSRKKWMLFTGSFEARCDIVDVIVNTIGDYAYNDVEKIGTDKVTPIYLPKSEEVSDEEWELTINNLRKREIELTNQKFKNQYKEKMNSHMAIQQSINKRTLIFNSTHSYEYKDYNHMAQFLMWPEDKIIIRHLFKPPVYTTSKFKCIFGSNELPAMDLNEKKRFERLYDTISCKKIKDLNVYFLNYKALVWLLINKYYSMPHYTD